MKKSLDYPAIADLAQLTGTTVVYRELGGEPQFVVVCGECDKIKTISIREAMQSALQTFIAWHREGRHSPPNAQEAKPEVKE